MNNDDSSSDEKPIEKGVISLNERRADRFKRNKSQRNGATSAFSQNSSPQPSKTNSVIYSLGKLFQIVAVVFGGYLVLRSCGLAK